MDPRLSTMALTVAQTAWNHGARQLVLALRNPGPGRLQRAAIGAGAMGGGAVLAAAVTGNPKRRRR